MNLSVLLVSPCMGSYGGLEAFVLVVAEHLSRNPSFTTEVIFKEAGSFAVHRDLLARVSSSSASVSFCRRFSASLWNKVQNADIVHLQNLSPDVAFMARMAGKPLLVTIHSRCIGRSSLHLKMWKNTLLLANQRFYVSEFVRRSWENSSSPWPKSRVVHSICELSELSPLPAAERKGFVFVARWIENKGVDVLVEAYARSHLNTEQWPLRLLGDGPLRPRIQSRLKELGLEGKVHSPGFISELQKAEWIRRSRFAVIPPNTQEDFGLVPLEARHLGLPCLITRDGGVPEAAGRHCLSCAPGDVDELASLLRQAAAMSESDYLNLASAAHASLAEELVHPSFYESAYRQLLAETGH
jgi:glycosyltransferase involved in cell wall biosynthesis